MGVCRGISDYFSLPVFWIRFTLVVFFVISGFFPIVFLYLLAGLIMKKEPSLTGNRYERSDSYDRYHCDNDAYSGYMKERLNRLKSKIRDMESTMSYREYQWNRKFYG